MQYMQSATLLWQIRLSICLSVTSCCLQKNSDMERIVAKWLIAQTTHIVQSKFIFVHMAVTALHS